MPPEQGEGPTSVEVVTVVINYMHPFFTNYRVWETCVDLNCDNCSGQNKNMVVLWYCAWWTMHKLHHSPDLHFLITGHTKCAPDWSFSLIKQRFRKTRVNTLSEIVRVVKDSTVTGVNIPQLFGLEDASMLWSLVLSPRSIRTVGSRFQLLHNADILPPIDGLPVQAPSGLDSARQTYLLEKIRE